VPIGLEPGVVSGVTVEPKLRFPETEADHQAAISQLAQILASPAFRNSRRNSKLLRYIVERTLEGRTELLKERLLGTEVFGRPPDYDTSSDHIVRSTAGEIRKRSAQFYLQPGSNSGIRIDLLPGSYIPQFRPSDAKTFDDAAESEKVSATPATASPRARSGRLRILLGGLFVILASSAVWKAGPSFEDRGAAARLWSPVLNSSSPIVLCMGDPRKAWAGSEASSFAGFASIGADPRPVAARAGTPDSWFYRNVPFGDAVALSRLTALIAKNNKEYRVVYSPDSTLLDLRENSAVIVGGIDNFWAMHLTRDLRYRFQLDHAAHTIFIEDEEAPGHREWQVPLDLPRNQVQIDYAIVARVVHPVTGRPVVVAGGIRDCGTMAASEFLSSNVHLKELEKHAPAQWVNMEAVISTKVFKGTPGPPRIVAAYFW
jgi:hypothetical protein